MKKAILTASVLFVGQMFLSAASSATPFASYEGAYQIISQTCTQNARMVECQRDVSGVTVGDYMLGREAILTFVPDGLSYTMVAFSHAMDNHEQSFARFSGTSERPVWTTERTFGDVSPLMTRTGIRIAMEPAHVEPMYSVLTITNYRYAPNSSTVSEEKYLLNRIQ